MLFQYSLTITISDHISPDSKVHGVNMGPIGVRQDLGGPHVGPMNFAISVVYQMTSFKWQTKSSIISRYFEC